MPLRAFNFRGFKASGLRVESSGFRSSGTRGNEVQVQCRGLNNENRVLGSRSFKV